MSLCRAFLVITVVTMLPLTAPGQTLGTVAGRLVGPGGLPVADVAVTLTHLSTGLTRTTNTDAAGRYTFAALPPGEYRLNHERPGFRAVGQTFTVTVAETKVVDLESFFGHIEDVVVTQ